jgi:hypothetical protein
VATSVKQDLREKKQRALKSYFAALNLRAVFKKEGNLKAVAEYELLMAVCLYRLQALRFQEIIGDWPLLVEPVK